MLGPVIVIGQSVNLLSDIYYIYYAMVRRLLLDFFKFIFFTQ